MDKKQLAFVRPSQSIASFFCHLWQRYILLVDTLRYCVNKSNPIIDRKVKEFAIELFKILFLKGASLTEKKQMAIIHIIENKVWACYFFGAIFVLALIVSSFI